jgi:hypothetical protein
MISRYNLFLNLRTRMKTAIASGTYTIKNWRLTVNAEEYALIKRRRPRGIPFNRLIVRGVL